MNLSTCLNFSHSKSATVNLTSLVSVRAQGLALSCVSVTCLGVEINIFSSSPSQEKIKKAKLVIEA